MFWADQVEHGKKRGHFDDALCAASAALIRERWAPEPFPTWVTCVPSLRTGSLVPSLAQRIARLLGLPFVDCIRKLLDTAPQKTMENSFYQASNLAGAFEVAASGVPRGPALLVDDIVDSRWTFTVVGALLRDAVGCIVYPFALAASTSA